MFFGGGRGLGLLCWRRRRGCWTGFPERSPLRYDQVAVAASLNRPTCCADSRDRPQGEWKGRRLARGAIKGPPVRDRDKRTVFCVYDAATPEAIRETAARSNLPVGRMTQVNVFDPYFYMGEGV